MTTAPEGCKHEWDIPAAAGPTSLGECSLCHEKREFKNSFEGADWRTASRHGSDNQPTVKPDEVEEPVMAEVQPPEAQEEPVMAETQTPETKEVLVARLQGKLPAVPTKAGWIKANLVDLQALVDLAGGVGPAAGLVDPALRDSMYHVFSDTGIGKRASRQPRDRQEPSAESVSGPTYQYLLGKVAAYELMIEHRRD